MDRDDSDRYEADLTAEERRCLGRVLEARRLHRQGLIQISIENHKLTRPELVRAPLY
jgi:hypothetical protein